MILAALQVCYPRQVPSANSSFSDVTHAPGLALAEPRAYLCLNWTIVSESLKRKQALTYSSPLTFRGASR